VPEKKKKINKAGEGTIVIYFYLKQDADPQIHEGFCEIDDAFSGVINGHRTDGQIRFLKREETNLGSDSLLILLNNLCGTDDSAVNTENKENDPFEIYRKKKFFLT